MRKEIEELIGKWDHFRDVRVASNSYELDENDVNTYKSLMSESFRLLKAEWAEEKINKDIALLFATIGFFSAKTTDDDGNVLGNDEYDRITTLNMFFVNELFHNNNFRFDEEGQLLLQGFEDDIRIETTTFEIPSLDELYA